MKVNTQTNIKTVDARTEKNNSVEIKKGEEYSGRVKENVSDKESVVLLKGREVRVKLDTPVEEGKTVTFKAESLEDGAIKATVVKQEASDKQVETKEASKVIESFGLKSNETLEKAVSSLMKEGVKLDKETLKEVEEFLKSEGSTKEEKLETIKMAAQKNVEITKKNLQMIDKSLNGNDVKENIENIAKELDVDMKKVLKPKNEEVKQDNVKVEVKEETEGSKVKDSFKQIDKEASKEPIKTETKEATKEPVKTETKEVNKEPVKTETKEASKEPVKTEVKEASKEPVKTEVKEVTKEPVKTEAKEATKEPVKNETSKEVQYKNLKESIKNSSEQVKTEVSKENAKSYTTENIKEVSTEVVKDVGREAIKVQEKIVLNQTNKSETKEVSSENIKLKETIDAGKEIIAERGKFEDFEKVIEKNLTESEQKEIAKTLKEGKILSKMGYDREAVDRVVKELENKMSDNKKVLDTKVPNEQAKALKVENGTILKENSTLNKELNTINLAEKIEDAKGKIVELKNFKSIKEFIENNVLSNKNIDSDILSKIEAALKEFDKLTKMGYEQKGMLRFKAEIENILKDIKVSETEVSNEVKLSKEVEKQNSEMVASKAEKVLESFPQETKNYVVTRVTQRMNQAATTFKTIKREISQNLDTVIKFADATKANVSAHTAKSLESAIDKLDKAILKSDMMLFTDMKMEKKLVLMSSKLSEARRMLEKGMNQEASKVLKEVKTTMDKINWKPTDTKVMHLMKKEAALTVSDKFPDKYANILSDAVNLGKYGGSSSKEMYDTFKSLGLNYERDVMNSLMFKGKDGQNEDLGNNLKALLLKMVAEQAQGQENSGAVKALEDLNGQQLLNKQDVGSHNQNMFFNIPVNMDGNLENVKLFVNANKKNKGEKIDWENTSLYFVLDTKKMGETGIMISAVDRNLSITIKNDKDGLNKKVDPLVPKVTEKLEEIGYKVSGVNVTKLKEGQQKSKESKLVKDKSIKKASTKNKIGFDLKI